MPNLLALQTESFDRLMGNERWVAQVKRAQEIGDDSVVTTSGLAEIFDEISPIEDYQGTMSLSFSDPEFSDPKMVAEEAKERDASYAAPLYVKAEFMNYNTGEIKQQTVFMGDFPLMTDEGTFIINGTERVVVSQLVRSPGAYFERSQIKQLTKTSTPPASSHRVGLGSNSKLTVVTKYRSDSIAVVNNQSPCY